MSGVLPTNLPARWRQGRLNQVADAWPSNVDKHSVEGQVPVRLCNYTDVYRNDTIVAGMDFMAATATPEQVERFRLLKGDTIITKDSETADDIGVPAFVECDAEDLVCGYHLAIVRPNEGADPRFLYWAMTSQSTLKQWAVLASGVTRVGIRSADLTKVAMAIPPRNEQRAIANYLDRETAQIDELIAEQQRLIGLLRERRDSSRAVLATRGIGDPTRLIESGLSWSEWVPSHWSIVPLSSVASLESGHTPSRERPELWTNCSIPWISLNDVRELTANEYIASTKNLISADGISASSARVLPAGTVVLSRDATVGRSSVMAVPMATSQHFANWICGPRLDPNYLWLLFTSAMQPYFESLTNGSTLRTIGMGLLKSFRIPLPPLEEQSAIVHEARRQTAKVDALIAAVERFIELSWERRAGLITAAVTGQIDIREVA